MTSGARLVRIFVAAVAAALGLYLFATSEAQGDTLRTVAFLSLLMAMGLLVFAAVRQARRNARDESEA